jgi:signal transduction histidine kinase
MNKRILLIEDDTSIARALTAAIGDRAFVVHETSGHDGIRALKLDKFHAIITDYQMNKGTGLDVIKFCTENKVAAPIIMLTAYGTKELISSALNSHVFRFLAKPHSVSEIIGAVDAALKKDEESAQLLDHAAIGRMAGFLVHEINNPICVLSLTVDGIKSDQGGQASTKAMNRISTATDRIIKIIRWTKDKMNSKESPVDKHPFELSNLISSIVEECLEKSKEHNVMISYIPPVGTIEVVADEAQIVQAVVNLVNNSIEAVSQFDERWVTVSVESETGYAKIIVKDSGNGIDPETAEKMFRPLYTTKKTTGGSGLGLSVVQSVAERHNGSVKVNTQSKNTTFEFRLPVGEYPTKTGR